MTSFWFSIPFQICLVQKLEKIKAFPAKKKVKLFRVTISTDRTDYVATNDLSQSSTNVAQQVCKIRWKIESC